uniref:C-type lectin domain-containing protein n=1 Tax=Poecilia latipinna TaxID=48699 RepID=A0A3B3UD59_9TELE
MERFMSLTLLAGQHVPKLFSSKTFILRDTDSQIFMPFCATGLCSLSLAASQYRYVLFSTPKTWKDARIYCRENCLDLATIYYQEEMNEVMKLVESGRDDAWFGLFEAEKRSWHWSLTGRDFYKEGETDFYQWDGPQSYHCGYYEQELFYTLNESSRWGGLDCTEMHPFLCSCLPGSQIISICSFICCV